MTRLRMAVAVFACLALGPARLRAVEWQPILDLQVLGGKTFFDGSSSSFGGNGSLLFAPALLFSPRLSVVPAYAANYRRTRQVTELAGGGFLTQESQDHLVTVKSIYKFSPAWQGKAKVSYSREFVLETDDESWGNGLFDSEKIALGFEGERSGTLFRNLQFAVDVYRYRFPNYQALSQQDLGTEINSGNDVLNFIAADPSVSMDVLLWKDVLLSFQTLFSYRRFGDQNIVQESGTYVDKKRRDLNTTLGVAVQTALPRFHLFSLPVESGFSVNASYVLAESNQHSYDADQQHFTNDYYDYREVGVGPSLRFFLGKNVSFSTGYAYTRRSYTDRLVQDADGNFTSTENIFIATQEVNYSVAYAITKNFDLIFQGSSLFSHSNMSYEATYEYKFNATHFLTGIGYHF